MKIELRLLNCLLLILPLLVWNLVLGSRLTDARITSDAHSSKGLLIAENLTRIVLFVFPLLMPIPGRAEWQSSLLRAGLAVYFLGTLVYFASWLPLIFGPHSAWSNSVTGLLAPRLTPFLSFLGIAIIGGAWPYGVLSAVFTFIHIWHGIKNPR